MPPSNNELDAASIRASLLEAGESLVHVNPSAPIDSVAAITGLPPERVTKALGLASADETLGLDVVKGSTPPHRGGIGAFTIRAVSDEKLERMARGQDRTSGAWRTRGGLVKAPEAPRAPMAPGAPGPGTARQRRRR